MKKTLVSEVKEAVRDTPAITYPCLMRSKRHGDIVLFVAYREGTVVSKFDMDHPTEIGYHSVNFSMDQFEPFEGSVTLSMK